MWRSAVHQAQEVIPTSQLYHGPTDLAATAVASTQINLSWIDNAADEAGFKIERSTNGSTWSQIATTPADVTTYTAGGLASGTTYYFRVRGYTSSPAMDSGYSNTASAQTLTGTSSSPSKPGNGQRSAALFSSTTIESTLLEELEASLT